MARTRVVSRSIKLSKITAVVYNKRTKEATEMSLFHPAEYDGNAKKIRKFLQDSNQLYLYQDYVETISSQPVLRLMEMPEYEYIINATIKEEIFL